MPLVLVVDDDAAVRRLVGLSLSEGGFEVVTAGDGIEALAVLDERRVDVIVLDLMMPNMDGRTFARTLRERGSPRIPILLLAADASEQVRRETHADAAMTKPFDAEALVAAVRAVAQ